MMIPTKQAQMLEALIEAGVPRYTAERLAREFYDKFLEWEKERAS